MGLVRSRAVRLLVAPVVGLAALVAGSAAGAGTAGASSSPFTIVIDTGVTGPYGANGTAAVDGTKAAANVHRSRSKPRDRTEIPDR